MRVLRVFPALVLMGTLISADGCGDDIAGPVDDGLRLEVDVNPRQIQPGQVGSITIRLQNLKPVGATITFSSTCQVLTFARGVNVDFQYPPNGGYGCGDMITSISLLPYEQRIETLPIYGSGFWLAREQRLDVAIIPAGIHLPAGRYAIHAELAHNYGGTELRSRSTSFEIK